MPDIFDRYDRLFGGGGFGGDYANSGAGFGGDSLSYLDAVLQGHRRYNFDRPLAQQPAMPQTPEMPSWAPPGDSYATFSPDQTPPPVDVGTGIPLSRDRTPVQNNDTGTAYRQFMDKVGDIGTGAVGLAERFNKGVANTLGFRQPDGDIHRGEIPVMPGVTAVADALTALTGGLTSSLAPAGGAFRTGAQYAAPAARQAAQEAMPVMRGLLADETGAINLSRGLTPRARQAQEITLGRALPEAEPLPAEQYPTAPGHNALYYGQQMLPDLPPPSVPGPRQPQVAPVLPRGREANFGEQLRAQHLEREDALPLTGARMQVTPPPHITNEVELDALVDRYVNDVLSGQVGKYWYEKSGKGILAHTGDPEVATPFAGGLARTSPQTDVASNLTHAVTLHNQYMAGDPLSAGRFPNAMGTDVEKIYRGGEKVTGEKIGPFMGAVAHQWAPHMFPHDLVNDIWNMRILEYPNPHKPGELYSGSPSGGQHNFARIVADRARQKIEAITGEPWEPRQVQASGWTGGKARLEGTTVGQAAFNFSDALRRNYAQLSWESAPGATTGHFPEYHSAPWEVKNQYHQDIRNALTDDEGRDIIASHLGLLTGRTFDVPGYFGGVVSPGSQSPAAVGQAPGGALKGIDPASRELLLTAERVRGLLLRQDAIAGHKPLWAGNVPLNRRDLFDATVGRSLTPDETAAIARAMHEATGVDFHSPVGTPDGFRFINVPDASGVPNERFVTAAGDVIRRDDILPGETVTVRQTASDGFYEPNDWRVEGDGETYRRGLGATRSPDLQRRAAELLATLGERVGAVQDRYAQTHGWTHGSQRRFWEEPAYQDFKLDQIPRPPRPGEVRSSAEIGPGWRPLFGPGSILGSLLAMVGGGAAMQPQGAEAAQMPPAVLDQYIQMLGGER